MLFNSFSFAVFLPIVVIIFYALPHRFRWLWLLLSSCFFYMAYIPWFILVIGTTIVIDYFAGILISKTQGIKRKYWLLASLITNIGILFFFKYFNFFFDNIAPLLGEMGIRLSQPNWHILLPVGLSFHTFQAMSYTIEVYRGAQNPEKHFGIYALYVMFFPQMVAGPIERPQNMLHQFHEYKLFDSLKFASGLRLMLWGFFKKMVIADRAAIVSDQVFNNPQQYGTLGIAYGIIMFAFRIYGDFSGYTDIARGAARILGFDLMLNFRQPYLAESVSDFWRRWHISLSTWFRDYLYIPLGGNRGTILIVVFNLLITFIISGLWHGADWKFVVWGGLNGVFIAVEYIWRINKIDSVHTLLPTFLKRLKTFFLIGITWIFFAAPSMKQAILALQNLFHLNLYKTDWANIVLNKDAKVASLFILLLICIEIFIEKGKLQAIFSRQPVYVRWAIYAVLAWTIILFGQFGERQFIYFVF